ncbi:PALP-domain-containing protein [Epithele typhae]|uniref:PALP-domain-containing protein n=1 Tax=Epithele typhae TaxID=378194 RepID=UPI0020089000|nr:PALP-domain-containing protein [Epithele typhae]KAH9929572.1 PALP-domain-containing protein [Epithele typhae]
MQVVDHVVQWLPARSTYRQLLYGVVVGLALSLTASSVVHCNRWQKQNTSPPVLDPRLIEPRRDEVVDGVVGLIGNTPLVRINSLSNALGVEILGKAEFMNPGGSVKDRVALRVITDAEEQGLLRPHTSSRIFEGTVGSTAIIMPDDVAEEKVKALLALGAEVERVRPASIVDKKQNLARDRASIFVPPGHLLQTASASVVVTTTADGALADDKLTNSKEERESATKPRGFFADQFENRSNYYAHYDGTGPEIWRQTSGAVDAFVSGAGTGGTLAGPKRDILVAMSDPEGSGLYNKVKYGGTKRRHQSTRSSRAWINRLTHNFELALPIIDDAFRVTDEEAVAMSRYLVHHDGLFLGSSSACNLVACIRLVKKLKWKSGERIVTILCDSGCRHYSKFWNDEYLAKAKIPIDMGIIDRMLTGSV